jgi:hypothetical protein
MGTTVASVYAPKVNECVSWPETFKIQQARANKQDETRACPDSDEQIKSVQSQSLRKTLAAS